MKLPITQLREGENPFQFDSLQDSWLRDIVHHVERQGYEVQGPMRLDLNLTRLDPDYYLRGQLVFAVHQNCARCAEQFTLPIQHSFTVALAHVSTTRIKSSDLTNEESEELDVNFFEGNEIDFSPIAQEQFFLSIPYQSLCQANCKGMCQHCGHNLNEGPCRCKLTNPISPFSQLGEYKLNSK